MIYLLTSIVCISVIYLIFRSFGKYHIDAPAAIAYNYLAAAGVGWVGKAFTRGHNELPDSNPMVFLLLLGFAFFIVFNLMQRTTHVLGVSASTIVGRMSLVIPVGVSVFFYNESLSLLRIGGILLALASIFITIYQPDRKTDKKGWRQKVLLTVLTFVGVGAIDALLKISQEQVLDKVDELTFVTLLYSSAFICGFVYLLINKERSKLLFKSQNAISGIILGIINFFSIYLFILALRYSGLEGSIIFPVNSVGIVIISSVLALIILKEKLTKMKLAGLLLAVVALLMIYS
jgi:drug/metabolite transporter (DMT)-like permease